MNKKIRVHLTGQAGVHRVASEIEVRGVNVYFPSVDEGTDLLTGSFKRIQVKAGHIRHVVSQGKEWHPSYWFHLGMRQVVVNGKRKEVPREKKYSEEVDFLVFWGIDEDRFWIVPSHLCDGMQTLVLWAGRKGTIFKPRPNSSIAKVAPYEGRWELLAPPESDIDSADTQSDDPARPALPILPN